MRILFATYTLAFQNPGGGERVLLSLKRELESLGHFVELYNPWKHQADQFKQFDVIHYFSCIEKSFWTYSKLSASKVPLIITPTSYFDSGFQMRWLSLKIKVLNTFFSNHDQKANPWRHLILPDYWLPNTEEEACNLVRYWNILPNKVEVLPNGVDSNFFEGEPQLFLEKTGIQQPFILHVGRFHPVKNQLKLIESARLAKMRCVFIGSPDSEHNSYYEQCRRLAKATEESDLTHQTQFYFIPALDHHDPLLSSAYSAALALALPSHFESFGLVALEAAAAGTQLLLTQNIKNKLGLESVAKFLNPLDAREWAREMRNLSSHHLAEENRNFLKKQYSWSAIGRKLEQIYQSILTKSKCD